MKKLLIVVAALSLAVTFAMTAAAAEWNFYGSARVETFWTDTDNVGTTRDTQILRHDLQPGARVGANVKASDELTGHFEFGMGGTASWDNEQTRVRFFSGSWNFGSGVLTVGQTMTPLNLLYSDTVYDDGAALIGYGSVFGGRQPLVQVAFGDFKIALVQPTSTVFESTGSAADLASATGTYVLAAATYASEVSIPAIEAAYTLKLDPVTLKLQGAYQTYEATSTTRSFDVDSYAVAFGADFKFGAASLAGGVFFGQNAGALFSAGGNAVLDTNTTTLSDNETMGYQIVGNYTVNDMLALEAGYGYKETELDDTTAINYFTDDSSQYYLKVKITLAPGVVLEPEVGVRDGGKSVANAEQADATYYGLRWMINF
jgi:hypothetical protein